MQLYIEHYIAFLLLISFGFFYITTALFTGTNEPYRDLLITIAVVHYVMSKLITIKTYEKNKRNKRN
ncbi:hypothetical protein [Lysinibacillus telephonicus]|uniref:Uncharacterized protein n=1 Tax=Lysinibacillus telephonicus TaxID=1714840 RepID=A0A431UVL6_9BACI|nr:hypothetical protein [Lysinibacillus telephonicus]RTQ95082.1 hypothetical protein EKG35_04215 [Lysinibacillus telephonicus]